MVTILFVSYFVFLFLLYFIQDKLLFYPQPLYQSANIITNKYKNTEEIKINTADNIMLHGWLIKNTTIKKSPLIIYFGGNAEEISQTISEVKSYKDWAVSLINYRGYGLSEGNPSENNFFADALTIYDYYAKRKDIDNRKIVVMGRSIGTGVAVYLAQNRKVTAVILVSPYDSIISVVQEKLPFVPVFLLLKHKFNSLALAPLIKVPLLALASDKDNIILLWHSKKLVQKWAGPHTLKIIKNKNHNDINFCSEYWEYLNDFLKKIN